LFSKDWKIVSGRSPPADFLEACRALGVALAPHQLDQLSQYLSRLREANRNMNLTTVDTPREAWRRHLLDSLTLIPRLGGVDRLADIGSGGGLPGIPLAIARPGLAITLIEATGKKARFLKQVVDELRLTNVQVRAERAERLGRDPEHRESYDVATGRAVGPLNVFLELAAPLVRVGGRIVAMKGRRAGPEIQAAEKAIERLRLSLTSIQPAAPGMDENAVLVELIKLEPTPAGFPRAPGMAAKRPL
jgi:16S rRNA (guanine527-N7)-methyltransferase